MERYRLQSDMNQAIVNGILQGYKNYLEERKVKREEMNISTAYAWVKGNHIDDQTAGECKALGVDFRKAKAGYTWGYLQFQVKQKGKSMFIVKNGEYFDKNNFPRRIGDANGSNKEKNNYLRQLSKINDKVDFPKDPSLFTMEQERQMLFFDDQVLKNLDKSEAQALAEEFDQFYIVTYETDEFFAICKISLLMPNSVNDKAYEIEDLSKYIGTSTVIFEESDYEVLVDEASHVPETTAAILFGIVPEDELLEEDKD